MRIIKGVEVKWIIAAAVAASSCAAIAQTSLTPKLTDADAEKCGRLRATIESVDKTLALRDVWSIGDDSAFRQQVRKQDLQIDLAVAAMALNTMIAMRCTPLPMPPTANPLTYFDSAHACVEARKSKAGLSEPPPECDMAKWKSLLDPVREKAAGK